MDRPNRVVPRRRVQARPRPEDSATKRDPASGQPGDRLVQIDVTFILPRRLGWLLAGIAIGNLHLPDGLLDKASHILQALLTG